MGTSSFTVGVYALILMLLFSLSITISIKTVFSVEAYCL